MAGVNVNFLALKRRVRRAPPEAWHELETPWGLKFRGRETEWSRVYYEQNERARGGPDKLTFDVHPDDIARVDFSACYYVRFDDDGEEGFAVDAALVFPTEEFFTDETWVPNPD